MNQITEQTKIAYEKEIQELYGRMPEMEERVKDARALGDISENEEYSKAQEELTTAQSRIIELENILRTSQVAKDTGGPEIVIGSYVRITKVDESGNALSEPKLFILDSVERYLDGHIGVGSPLGREILNNVSKNFIVTTNHGNTLNYKVEKLPNNDETSKEFTNTYQGKDKLFSE